MDRDIKPRRLISVGVREVWLVDPMQRAIAVHGAAGIRTARGKDEVTLDVVPRLAVTPTTLFSV